MGRGVGRGRPRPCDLGAVLPQGRSASPSARSRSLYAYGADPVLPVARDAPLDERSRPALSCRSRWSPIPRRPWPRPRPAPVGADSSALEDGVASPVGGIVLLRRSSPQAQRYTTATVVAALHWRMASDPRGSNVRAQPWNGL